MVFNKGMNDLSCDIESYPVWHSMIRRCYSEVYHKNKPSYIGMKVCDNWLYLSNFNNWFVLNYVQGWQLDKDLLFPESRMYSEQNCIFLPNEINCALQIEKSANGLPPGVSYKTSHSKYVAQLSMLKDGKRVGKHLLISDSIEDCFEAYINAKESYMKKLADLHIDKLDKRAYDALFNFSVRERMKGNK